MQPHDINDMSFRPSVKALLFFCQKNKEGHAFVLHIPLVFCLLRQ